MSTWVRGSDYATATRKTANLVVSQGGGGSSYRQSFTLDPNSDPAFDLLNVWLVEIEVTGKENRYGPISPVLRGLNEIFLPYHHQKRADSGQQLGTAATGCRTWCATECGSN